MRLYIRKEFIVLFIFIFLLLLSQSLFLYIEDINSSIGYEKLIIGSKEGTPIEFRFSVNEAKLLDRIVSSQLSTYYAVDESLVWSEQGTLNPQAYGVMGNFSQFNMIKLKKGSFINDNDNNYKKNVAVIEDTVAQKLFKSENVIGLNINIYNKKFTVIGITSTKRTAIEKLLHKESERIYIPLNTMKELKPNINIANIEYKNVDSYIDMAFIKDKIVLMGKNPDDFFIEDLNIKGIQQRQKYNILIFILGIFSIYGLLKVLISIIKYMYSFFKTSLEKYYFLEALKAKTIVYIKSIIVITGIILLQVFIWKRISFSLYIEPDKIPQNPANIYSNLLVLKEYVTDFVSIDYFHPLYEIKLSRFLERLNTIVFFIGIVLESYWFFIVARKQSIEVEDMVLELLNLCLYFDFSILLSIVVIHLLGLPVKVSNMDILIIWISIVVNFLFLGIYSRGLNGAVVFEKLFSTVYAHNKK